MQDDVFEEVSDLGQKNLVGMLFVRGLSPKINTNGIWITKCESSFNRAPHSASLLGARLICDVRVRLRVPMEWYKSPTTIVEALGSGFSQDVPNCCH